MTIQQNNNEIRVKLNNAWVAWLMLAITIVGSIVGFTRFAESKVDRAEVEKIIADKLAPLNKTLEYMDKNLSNIERMLTDALRK